MSFHLSKVFYLFGKLLFLKLNLIIQDHIKYKYKSYIMIYLEFFFFSLVKSTEW